MTKTCVNKIPQFSFKKEVKTEERNKRVVYILNEGHVQLKNWFGCKQTTFCKP